MSAPLFTYRVLVDRATVRTMRGVAIRRMGQGEMFQGRPAAGDPTRIARIGDDGETPTGYVRADSVERVELTSEVGK